MPLYPLKKIGALAQSRQVFLRGTHGYDAGWVRQYQSSANAFYPEYAVAQVQEDEQHAYHVEVGFDDAGEAEYLECGCPQFRPGEGACKHIVAVLTYKYYQDMVAQLPTAAQLMAHPEQRGTDPAAQRLIDRYMTRESARLTAQSAPPEALAVLTPMLRLQDGRAAVSFTVGTTRPYVVKNLSRFAQAIAQGETLEYGKQLRLTHQPEAFVPESRPLLHFLLGELCERPAATLAAAPGELPLSPAALDRFLALPHADGLRLRQAEGDVPLRLADGDPKLTLTVEQQPAGVRLWGEPVTVLTGLDTLYLLRENTLWRTSAAYARCMGGWLQETARSPHSLYIAAAALPAFCAGVLATVAPYVTVEGDTQALAAYRPRPLEVRIYLDAPEPDAVTARVEYHYGEDTVLPFLGEPAAPKPWQDPLAELRVGSVIRRQFTALQPQTGLLVLRGEDDRLFDFITRGVEALRQVAAVYASESFDRLLPTGAPRVAVGLSLQSELLRLDVELPELDEEELAGILAGFRAHRPYHRLRGGRFIRLEDDALAGLAEAADSLGLSEQELRSGHVLLPKYRALYLEGVLRRREGLTLRRDEAIRGLEQRWQQAAESDWPLPEGFCGTLREYQKHGYRWLRTMEALGFGGILADEMGLGKTVQIITLLLAARQAGEPQPSLVVCPTSLVLNWERELQRFAPALRVLCITGTAAAREQLLAQAGSYDVLITSYDTLKRDVAAYAAMHFHYLVLDEAQYIKNSHTQNAKAAKAIDARQRFALTGTPMENRLSELWSIFDFLMPGLLFSYPRFRDRYEAPVMRQGDKKALERLSRLTAPFILRRLKSEVLTELPEKTQRVLPAVMEPAQRQTYLAALAALRAELEAGRGGRMTGQGRMTVLAMLTRLRQICCDPRLCCENYTGGSCKLEACMELLKEAAAGGHRVLLFSQFTSMLELLRQRLEAEGIGYYLLQGSTPSAERAALTDAFNRDDTPVFLISLKAGGTGLNLVGADMVIHYDPWWNLSAQNQATDRAHRIGQKRPVQVVRLIARDTIEEKILQLQEDKWQLAQSVIGTGAPDVTTMSAEELLALLE